MKNLIFDFTASQFIDYVIHIETELAHMKKSFRDYMIEHAEREFQRANPREYREYCLMIIRAFTPCK